MNVSKILDKILNEQENLPKAKGIDYKNTFDVLNSGKNSADSSCATLKFLGGIKQMTPTFPIDGNVPLLNKFKEIYDLKPSAVAYAGGMNGNNPTIVFGIINPSTQSGKPGLYAYTLINGQPAINMANGAGSGCIELQKFEDVGKVPLSEYDKAIVDSIYGKFGVLYDTPDKTQMGNYEKIFLKDIPGVRNPQDGFIWVQKTAALQKFRNTNVDVNNTLIEQGFTATQPSQNQGGKFGFSLGMVQSNVGPGGKPTDYYWVDANSPDAPNLDPDRETCRTAIKKLHSCMSTELKRGATPTECDVDVVKNKFTALRCKTKNFIGGPIGLGDEFEDLQKDATTPFGLRRMSLANITPEIPGVQTESSLDFKINNLLNEEHKKFSFSDKKKINFDKNLIENISTQLVLSAYHDLERDMKKFNRLNENVFSNVTGSLGFNLADGLTQGLKETILRKALKYLGFDTKSYIGLLVINTFANLEITDYREFFTNCPKFTKIIVKSALEAWLDLAMQKIGKSGGFDVEGIVYAALKNVVTETASNTSVFMRLENMAKNIVCPIIENMGDMIGDKLGV